MAGITSAGWFASRRSPARWARSVRPWAKELTFILALYGLWQYAGAWSLGRLSSAMGRGQAIWNVERRFHLPSERSAQLLVLHHHSLVRWINEFYAYVHVPAMGACLVWLFVRHRDLYPPIRTAVALVTGSSLAIQLLPVAPPRLLPATGMVDTGAVIGPSDYTSGAPGIDQLSAMPSLHVGWAVIVGFSIVWVSRNRWRWLALGYPLLTIFAVTVTGNHFWADSLAGVGLCALAAFVVSRAYGSRPPDVQSAARPLDHLDADRGGRNREVATTSSVSSA